MVRTFGQDRLACETADTKRCRRRLQLHTGQQRITGAIGAVTWHILAFDTGGGDTAFCQLQSPGTDTR